MKTSKVVESSRLQIVIDENNLPSLEKQEEIINEICDRYDIDRTKNEFIAEIKNPCTTDKVTYEIKINATEDGLPVVAALEVFVMMMGNIMIYEKVLEYRVC